MSRFTRIKHNPVFTRHIIITSKSYQYLLHTKNLYWFLFKNMIPSICSSLCLSLAKLRFISTSGTQFELERILSSSSEPKTKSKMSHSLTTDKTVCHYNELQNPTKKNLYTSSEKLQHQFLFHQFHQNKFLEVYDFWYYLLFVYIRIFVYIDHRRRWFTDIDTPVADFFIRISTTCVVSRSPNNIKSFS